MNTPARRFQALGSILALSSLCLAAPAMGQVAASLSLESDYRFRGVTLSDGHPVLSLSGSYDHKSGAYAGASALAEDTAHDGVQMLGFIEYAGFAVRSSPATAWDFGVSNSNFSLYRDQKYRLHYTEIYAGWGSENLSGRIYYSPNYFGAGTNTLYAELNGALSPAPQWRLFGHVGVLSPLAAPASPEGRRERYDLRAGVARAFKDCELRLTFTAATPRDPNPSGPGRKSNAIVLGATVFF